MTTKGDYIYAGAASETLLYKLFNETQRQVLISAGSYQEYLEALQGTFFGTYLTSAKGDLEKALHNVLIDLKKSLVAMAPQPEILDIMWHKYDFQNLRILLKRAEQDKQTQDEEKLFPMGTYSLETLAKVVETGNFSSLDQHLAAAMSDVKKNPNASISAIMDRHYLEYAVQKAEEFQNEFLKEYTTLLVDLFNLRTRLRSASQSEDGTVGNVKHVSGGTIPPHNLDKTEDILNRLSLIGVESHWKEGIESYKERGDFTLIDRAVDDYIMKWLKRKSIDLDSPAPMFSYFVNAKQNVQFIRAVGIAKYVGLSEKLLRDMIRKSRSEHSY